MSVTFKLDKLYFFTTSCVHSETPAVAPASFLSKDTD